MQGDDASTVRTGPLLFFFAQTLLFTNCFDTHTILDQADLVSLPVAFVEALDGRTGKGRAPEAEIESVTNCTVFDPALPAMFGLACILPAAAQACFLLSQMHITDRAGDSAGCQHARGDFGVHFHGWLSRCLIGLSAELRTAFDISFLFLSR
jgi:hypothetical protein